MYAVFNIATATGSIRAKTGPSLRIKALYQTKTQAEALSAGQLEETRMWPMSACPKTEADALRETVEAFWRPITGLNLARMSDDDAVEALQAEYASIDGRFAGWVLFREAEDLAVRMAQAEKRMRPVNQVRAEMLLAALSVSAGTKSDPMEPLSSPSGATGPKSPRAQFLEPEPPRSPPRLSRVSTSSALAVAAGDESVGVKELDRQSEVRGQTWAMIGIVGDAVYETAKACVLEALGAAYFERLQAITGIEDLEAAERAFYGSDESAESAPNGHEGSGAKLNQMADLVDEARAKLNCLTPEEPMVAFFAADDDPSALTQKAAILAKAPNMKHVDLAVVRMYAWLELATVNSANVHHESRTKEANDFFKSFRTSTSS